MGFRVIRSAVLTLLFYSLTQRHNYITNRVGDTMLMEKVQPRDGKADINCNALRTFISNIDGSQAFPNLFHLD